MADKKAIAGRVKALAKITGPIFVLASTEPKLQKVEMASFKCQACNTPFKAEANSKPFCITCGSEEVIDEQGTDDFVLPETDDNLAAVLCSSKECGSHNILPESVTAAFGGNMHCVTCGEEMDYIAEELPDGDVDVVTDEVPVEDSGVGAEDLLETEEINSGTDNNSANTQVAETTEETTEEVTETEGDNTDVTDDVSDAAEESEESEDEVEEDSTSDETASMKLIDVVKSGEVAFNYVGDTLIASVGNVPVATLTKETAGQNTGIFHSRSFGQAVAHSVKQLGMQRALAHYGFELAEVTLPMPKLIEQKAEAKASEAKAKFDATSKEYADNLKHCLQIASAGLNKSFFKGKGNIIKAALFEELSALGIRNPAKVIDKVFAAKSDEYHVSLFEMASDLMSKELTARNQIAEAVGLSNYQVAEEMDEAEDSAEDSEEMGVDETLESAGVKGAKTPVTASVKDSAKKVSGVSTVKPIVASIKEKNGGRFFKIN